ncbi:hypothetical protein DICSQDRAFT_155693 [Dichomitus squalens LYAD-421 SS1]|uniref:AB hydrolase-1 domain-containing protein n=1 Tax=Dichomitus squalens (strain LYAD-421) TaxID=732165 RepID=R7SX71_DICSQ|nr:uncharacterized protein DICSQDRAFT_155693 [Dichomitus squalens LYAD-421 SS1]EJF60558.1 hypothetical protein DICSQDRAFT_155693 [Dichomitus squalens LYAD-421 SS1]
MSVLNVSSVLLLLFFYLFPAISAAAPHHPAPRQYTTSSLNVGNGTTLAYLDSGAPSSRTYTTIFAIHGMGFQSPVWEKVLDLAPAYNTRFVAINRRDYNGSTPYTAGDLNVLQNGTVSEQTAFFQQRGEEIATFIELFIKQNGLPAPSADGKTGGVALLGWSLGNAFGVSTIANIQTYATSTQQTLAKYLRGLVLQGSWSPQIDTSIPAADRQPGFVQWITAYFQHGDLSTRDVNVLEYVLPSITHVPSVFSFTTDQLAGVTNLAAASGSDTFIVGYNQAALLPTYRKALFNKTVRAAIPLLNVLEFTGDITANFGIVALWQIQDDDAAAGGGFVKTEILKGTNHFVHWDQPALALSTYLSVFD